MVTFPLVIPEPPIAKIPIQMLLPGHHSIRLTRILPHLRAAFAKCAEERPASWEDWDWSLISAVEIAACGREAEARNMAAGRTDLRASELPDFATHRSMWVYRTAVLHTLSIVLMADYEDIQRNAWSTWKTRPPLSYTKVGRLFIDELNRVRKLRPSEYPDTILELRIHVRNLHMLAYGTPDTFSDLRYPRNINPDWWDLL